VTTPRGVTSLPTGGGVYFSGFIATNKQTNKLDTVFEETPGP